MKNQIIIIITLLLSLYSVSQNNVKSKVIGKVVYLNSYKKPAVGVEITANGSSGDTSKDDGSYILNFPQVNIGATVFPKIGTNIVTDGNVSKIELVNTEQLKFYNIAEDASKAPLNIVVCPKGFRDEAAKKYYKIIRTETSRILSLKEKEIERLKEKYGKLSDSVTIKFEELNKLRKQHTDTTLTYKKALDIASINRDDAGDRMNKFLNALDEGKNIEEALKELSTKKAFKEAIEGGENIDTSIEEIKEEAKGLISIYEFEKAIQKYDTISIILRNKRFNPRLLISNLHILGLLCQNQNYFAKAESNYQEILSIYKNEKYTIKDYTYPSILNNLANLLKKKSKFTLADNYYREALNINRELAKINPNFYLPTVASSLNNLAILQQSQNEFPQALNNFEEALQIYKELSKTSLSIYLPDLANTSNNLAVLQQAKNDFTKALNNYEYALNIRRELVKKNPNVYTIYLARNLHNLANLQKEQNEFSLALNNYRESVAIFRKLAKKNPKVYLPDLAFTLSSLALLQQARNEFSQAFSISKEALEIYREIVEKAPKVYLPDLARALNNLAKLQQYSDMLPLASKNYKEALEIYEKLAIIQPSVYFPKVALSLNNLARLQQDKNEFSHALVNYQEALKIFKTLAKENPKVYSPYVAKVSYNLASLHKIQNQFLQSKVNYEEALDIFKTLAKENPKVYLADVASTLYSLAILLHTNNKFSLAESYYQESQKNYEELAKKNPTKYNIKLALSCLSYAYLKKDKLQIDFDTKTRNEGIGLVDAAKEALSIYNYTNPTKVSYNKISVSLESFFNNINESIILFNKIKNEITILKKQIQGEVNLHKKVIIQKEIIEKLNIYSKKYPEEKDTIIFLSQNYGSLAWFALLDKDFVLAEKSAKKGLELSPDEEWINTNLALSYLLQDNYEMAKSIYLNMKDKPYSNSTYSTAFIEDIEALEKSGITHKDFERVKSLLID